MTTHLSSLCIRNNPAYSMEALLLDISISFVEDLQGHAKMVKQS